MKILHTIALIVITLPTWIVLTKSGFFPMHDDIQAMRVLEMKKCLQDFQIPCRWVPDMGYGYGYPQFQYYPPLPYYYMATLTLLGISILGSVKIGLLTTFLLSGWGMYKLSREYYPKWGSSISTIAYLYVPYRAVNVYVRGAMGEIWAMALFPWVMYNLVKLIRTRNPKYVVYTAISMAALMCSHLLSTVMIAPAIAVWVGYELYTNKKNLLHTIKLVSFSALVSLGTASFYVLPSLGEKSAAHLETLTVGYFSYYNHFLSLQQLITGGFWGYGASDVGPYDGMFLGIGIWYVAFMLFACVSAILMKKNRMLIIALTGVILCFGFLTHPRSIKIWEVMEPLHWLQFPWRFLAPIGFLISFVIGSIIPQSYNSKKISLMIIMPMLINSTLFHPNSWFNITDQDKFSPQNWQTQKLISIYDYLPIEAQHPPTIVAPETPTVITGAANTTQYQKSTKTIKATINASEPSYIEFPNFNYPGWRLTINGQVAPIESNNELGLIRTWIPMGENQILLELRNTPIRLIANALTLVSFLYSIWALKKYSKT